MFTARWIVIFFLFLCGEAWGEFDLTLKATARSYPLSGALALESGCGYALWGHGPGSSSSPNPWYGYLRAYGKFSTAYTYNSGLVGAEIYPISFLGIGVLSERADNRSEYLAYDCEIALCQGLFQKEMVYANMGLALWRLFAFVRWSLETQKHLAKSPQDFIDPSPGLIARGEKDRLTSYTGVTGIELSQALRFFYLGQYNQMQEIKGDSRMHLINLSYKHNQWLGVVGLGLFESTLKKREFTALVRLQWTIQKGLGIL